MITLWLCHGHPIDWLPPPPLPCPSGTCPSPPHGQAMDTQGDPPRAREGHHGQGRHHRFEGGGEDRREGSPHHSSVGPAGDPEGPPGHGGHLLPHGGQRDRAEGLPLHPLHPRAALPEELDLRAGRIPGESPRRWMASPWTAWWISSWAIHGYPWTGGGGYPWTACTASPERRGGLPGGYALDTHGYPGRPRHGEEDGQGRGSCGLSHSRPYQ